MTQTRMAVPARASAWGQARPCPGDSDASERAQTYLVKRPPIRDIPPMGPGSCPAEARQAASARQAHY